MIHRARRRRQAWVGVAIAAMPVALILLWSTAMSALLLR